MLKGLLFMKRIKMLQVIILFCAIFRMAEGSPDDFRINQLGYYPQGNKVVPVLFTQESAFALVDTAGDTVYQGDLSEEIRWSSTGDTVKRADFSDFRKEGTYWLKVEDKGVSMPVHIRSNVLYDVSMAAFKTFYFQRASMALQEEFAGNYARKSGHPDTLCYYHESTEKDSGQASSPGGWYDAGDYGKYVVNAGVTLGNLFFFFENFGDYFGDSALNIPESKNGMDDLLDEIKYELDWLLTMQDTDGGVIHKLTTLQHAAMVMPDADKGKRYFIGKSTAATLDFAAVMAMAGRIYRNIENQKEFADTCISRAKRAWDWAVINPEMHFTKNPAGVGTGEYNDNSVRNDEFLWAAAELFITTGDSVYKDSIRVGRLSYTPVDWKSPGGIATYSLATSTNELESDSVEAIRNKLTDAADKLVAQIEKHAFRIPSGNYYYWGSNGVFSNAGLILIAAFKVSGDTTYARAAAEIADYLLGKNALSNSFVTGFGIKRSENPHHRIIVADTIKDAIPGFLVGGPNGSPDTYNDASGDYETNEIAINWNAPASALFASINKIFGKMEPTVDIGGHFLIQVVNGPGQIEVSPLKVKYNTGDTVVLKAVPEDGQMFLGWKGVIAGMDSVIITIVDKDLRIVADFGKPQELVKNGDFSNGRTGWSIWGASGSIADKEYKITITDEGINDWDIQLVKNGIPLLKGAVYVFQFDARSDSSRTIIADVAKSSGDYGSYTGGPKRCKLDTSMKHFEYKFTMKKDSDLGARITFNCGLSTKSVFLDNVSIKIFDPSPVLDQKFQRGTFLKPFKFRMNGNQVTFQLSVLHPYKAKLEVFDLKGRLKKNLSNTIKSKQPGTHNVFLGRDFSEGVYLIRYFDGSKLHSQAWTNLKR